MDQILLPQNWDAWQITGILGEGAYGIVCRAERAIGAEIITSAVKIIQVPSRESETDSMIYELGNKDAARQYYQDMVDDFIQEIRAMDALKGITNIVSIEDCAVVERKDRIGWTIFIRMEYLTPFPEYVQTHTLTESDIIRLGLDICTALSYCEKANIIHRDIKPSNIFVSPMGHFKLGDFGVARKLDQTSGVYSAKGTFPYMAPEVFNRQPYDRRADLYSLGLVLHHLLNRNREPFVDLDKQIVSIRDREEATNRRLAGEQIPPPADASPELAKVILKACKAEPEKRYPDAAAFRKALEEVQAADQPEQSASAWKRRVLPGILAAVILLLILLLPRIRNKTATDDSGQSPPATEATIPASLVAVTVPEDAVRPQLMGDQLRRQPMVKRNVISELLTEAGCVFTEEEQQQFNTTLKLQFVSEASPETPARSIVSPGDRIMVRYVPEEDFESLLRDKGFRMEFASPVYQVEETGSDKLRLVPVSDE